MPNCCTTQIYLGQAQKDPRLWQRLVGLVASDMPHPDHPAAHMIDQARLPLADAVAAIRREVRLARLNLDVSTQPDDADGQQPRQPGQGSGGGAAAESVDVTASGEAGGGAAEGAADSALALPSAASRKPAGILLPEQQQDTLLMHKVCEAEDFLDTVLHVVLAAGGAETPMLRRALGGRVPRGTLLGDALVMTLSGALASDLLTAAAELRHRTNRDRVITLGVDLAEKAKAFAGHRPEFTLTRLDRRGAAAQAAARAAAAAAALVAAQVAGTAPATAGVSLEHGVSAIAAAAAAAGSYDGGGLAADLSARAATVRTINPALLPPPDEDEDFDMDALRAKRRAAALAAAEQDAEAAVLTAVSAAAGVSPTRPGTGTESVGSPSLSPGRGRWRNVKAAALSKSAVIRMEMMTGRPQKGEPGSPSAVAAGHGAPMLATARRAMENRRVRGSGSPSLSPTRGRDAGGTGRSIAFDLGVDGAADSPGGWAGSDGDLSRGTTPQRGEALTRAASRVGSVAGGSMFRSPSRRGLGGGGGGGGLSRRNSMKSQASSVWGRESTAAGGMSLRNLVEGFSFSGPGGADSTVAEEAEPSEAEAEQAFTPRTEEVGPSVTWTIVAEGLWIA